MPLDIKKVKNKMFLKNNVQVKTLFMYRFIVVNNKPFFLIRLKDLSLSSPLSLEKDTEEPEN